jgi:hypothetical protein
MSYAPEASKMIEQVDWNFCYKVAETMESDKQEGITAPVQSCDSILADAQLHRTSDKPDTQANRMLPRPQALVSGLFSGVAGLVSDLVSALISGLAS